MTTPTFGGVPIFGAAPQLLAEPRPRPYGRSGVWTDGPAGADGGGRGTTLHASGTLRGPDAASLAAALALFRAQNDGTAKVLTDTTGTDWPDTLFETFEPSGRIRQTATGWFEVNYRATFLSLR